jgi:AmmeMemoRadiSam system protein A
MAIDEAVVGTSPLLAPADRKTLLRVARQALVDYLVHHVECEYDTSVPVLLAPGACFVTLWARASGELRGCRGEVIAHQPLIAAVAQMAVAAATDDPRFVPVTAAELPRLRIEISVMGPMQAIEPEEVELGHHGLMVMRDGHRGLLLPKVPIEHGMDRAAFLRAVCWKAGLPDDAWRRPGTALFGFTTDTWEEDPS